MSRRSTASIRLWLVAALFGLNALLLTGITQDSTALRDAAADQFSFHDDGPVYATVPGTDAVAPAHVRHVSRALLRASSPALASQAASLLAPVFTGDQLASENMVALGNSPRPTGPSRAPPAA